MAVSPRLSSPRTPFHADPTSQAGQIDPRLVDVLTRIQAEITTAYELLRGDLGTLGDFLGEFSQSAAAPNGFTYTLPDKSGTIALTSDLPNPVYGQWWLATLIPQVPFL